MSAKILLGHGGGGKLSSEWIEREIVPRFGDGPLKSLADGATLPAFANAMVVSTDSYVVSPLEFPGGDIGHLAVYGTVNDVAVSGGAPKWLSLSLILEEGFEISRLRRILDSLRSACERCNVRIVTGDTKVVPHGHCDGMYINTTGIGEAIPGFRLGRDRLELGDHVVVSGTIGDHGMAIVAARGEFKVDGGPHSDSGPVHELVRTLADLGDAVRFLRDPTRGGLAAVLNEIVRGREHGIILEEEAIPASPSARAMAEVVGMDLLHVASEGRVVAICDPLVSASIVARWRDFAEGRGAQVIGEVGGKGGRVVMHTRAGGRRIVDAPHGELLPRIC